MSNLLSKALVAAVKQAKSVGKEGVNKFHNYKYASAESVIAEAREALSDNGLTVIPMGWRRDPAPLAEKPEMQDYDYAAVTYRLMHESGESVDFETHTPIIPEKGRPADKALATALTYSLGYFLRGLLLLPRVDEETDADRRNDTNHQPRQRQAPATHPAQQRQDGPPRITREQAERLNALCVGLKIPRVDFCNFLGIQRWSELAADRYQHAVRSAWAEYRGVTLDEVEHDAPDTVQEPEPEPANA